MNRVISFSSGKGGVGKTTLAANLASLWAKEGKRVLLIDGDWALGKLSILFGAKPQWTVEQVVRGETSLSEAVTPVTPQLSLLASPSGVVGFEEMGEADRQMLFFEMEALRDRYDLILFDHSSGVHWGVLAFAAAAHQHVIVTTPEPTSYTDAYAIMKLLSKRFAIRDFGLVVTMADNLAGTDRVMSRFVDITRGQLDVRVQLLQMFPWEPKVAQAIRRQLSFIEAYPQSEFTARLRGLQGQLEFFRATESPGLQFFYEPTISTGAD
jgi:flagellar biosynthesis protein FlhG